MAEAVPLFERHGGGKVAVEIGLTSALRKAIAAGAAFDIALLPRPDIDALASDGRIAAGSVTVETLYLLGEEHRIVGISGYVVRPPRGAAREAARLRLHVGRHPQDPRR